MPNDAPTAHLVGDLLGISAGNVGWRILMRPKFGQHQMRTVTRACFPRFEYFASLRNLNLTPLQYGKICAGDRAVIGSISSFSRTISVVNQTSTASKTSTALFNKAMLGATVATVNVSSPSISDAAKSKASATGFDFDFSFTNVNHTQEEYAAHLAAGADRVSEMQGLPAGQYDFTNMSPKQMQVVQSHLIVSGKVQVSDVTGFPNNYPDSFNTDYTPTFSNEPRDWVSQVKSELSYNSQTKNDDAVFYSQRALDVMMQLMITGGTPKPPEQPDWKIPRSYYSQAA